MNKNEEDYVTLYLEEAVIELDKLMRAAGKEAHIDRWKSHMRWALKEDPPCQ